jgi:hypothetical protein
MLQKSKYNIIIDSNSSWKRRPSEIRGYQRALYLTTDEGDYVRVDYNIRENRVRLYIECADEGGNSYYSVIHNQKVTAEKSVSSGRSFGFSEKFRIRAEIFASIPNHEVLKLIGNNYGIGGQKKSIKEERKKRLEQTKKRYFKPDVTSGNKSSKKNSGLFSGFSLSLIDVIDFGIGAVISGIIFIYFRYSIIAVGIVAAFYGLAIGFIDMFVRGRPPVLIKVALFLFAGIGLFIRGYFLN